jgi:hypothetical protein
MNDVSKNYDELVVLGLQKPPLPV